MQSVPITTNVVILNPAQGEVYNIISDLRQVGGFHWYSGFFHQYNWRSRYTSNWNIVESGVKHHKTEPSKENNGRLRGRPEY